MRAFRLIFGAIGLATALLLYPSTTLACSPPPPSWTPEPHEQAVKRHFRESASVFVGTVISKTEEAYQMQDSSFEALRVSVLLTVTNTLKGPPQETILVKTGTGRGDCGYGDRFAEGATYLIYAGEYDANTLWVWRVVTASEMHEDIAVLQPSAHIGVGMPKAGASLYLYPLTIAAITGLVVVLGLVMKRKN